MLAGALVMVAGCGGGDQCSPTCDPACGAGTICSSELHGHIGAVRTGVCLTVCAHPSDCSGDQHCREFGGNAPFVCASDTVPALCPADQTVIDDDVGDVPSCIDGQTIATTFFSGVNLTRGHEMQVCANGCQSEPITSSTPAHCL